MRRSFPVVSIVIHAAVIAAALVGQTLADVTLPTPRGMILFDASRIMPVEVHVPPPPPTHVTAPPADAPSVSVNAAPTVAPTGVSKETGNEGQTPPPVGLISGKPDGVELLSDSLGIRSMAPPPPPEPPAPIHLGSGIRTPQKIGDVAPAYPPIAQAAHVQGVVILEAVLNAQGRVESVRVLRSIPLLDQAAVDAVRQWRYTPTLLNGMPVPVIMTVTVNFTLQNR